MARARATIQRYIAICEAYHAGFDIEGISVWVGSKVTMRQLGSALEWEREQVVIRSEIQSTFDALIETRRLRVKANKVLDAQWSSLTARTRRFAIKEVKELIDAELGYSNRIRELAREVDAAEGHEGLSNLPAGIFSADLEPDGGDGAA